MNPNDLAAQQQALLTQALERSQHLMWGSVAIQVALLILGAWVTYMFYARLRDIGDELRNIRVMYEMEQERTIRGTAAAPRAARTSVATSGDNPFASDDQYKPKPH